jgi:tripartite-type tricarboxylate transporter receptor subunit TctC
VTGRLTYMAITTALATPLIEAGKLRPLAVTSARRVKALPEVPTVIEAGIPDYVIDGWLALMAPVHTEPGKLAQLNKAIREGLAEPRMQAALTALNCEVTTGSPEQLGRYIQTDRDRWASIIKQANLKKD